ncbi:hypothetical protein TNCV_2574931 [Trichonephila clavipes]|nr:hypothetical protein TNCV_2574931 [Trichonephila clavipes]
MRKQEESIRTGLESVVANRAAVARERKKKLISLGGGTTVTDNVPLSPPDVKKPAPTDYTTDEEDMITYDVEEDELAQHPNLVQKDGRQYWKGSLLLTPTRLRK